MKRETATMRSISRVCNRMKWQTNDVLRKGKLLLQIYRDVVWAISEEAANLKEKAQCSFGHELNSALTYLNEFAPLEQKEEFEIKVSCLFETKWMIELVDNAMIKVYNYHNNGKLYHEIIAKSYLTAFKYTESELLEVLCMDRSSFYEKKKEAIMLFGIAMWGYAIPEMGGIDATQLMLEMNNLDFFPDYFTDFSRTFSRTMLRTK